MPPGDGTGLNTAHTDVSEPNAHVLAAVVPRWTGVAGRDVVASTRSVLGTETPLALEPPCPPLTTPFGTTTSAASPA